MYIYIYIYSAFRLMGCPQHGSWWLQPLLAQVLPGKSEAIPPLHDSPWLSKITKKNNHIPYNMRWKCCPLSSTHFWHLFKKCAFTWINSIAKIQSISCLIFAFNSSNVWWLLHTFYFSSAPIDKNCKPHTLEELKASIRCEIDCISETESM